MQINVSGALYVFGIAVFFFVFALVYEHLRRRDNNSK